jgi:hypothetical protein
VFALVAVGIAAVVAVVLLLMRRPPDGPYALIAWDYGAIAWVEPIQEDLVGVAATAAGLFDDAFALWGFSPPEVVESGRVARKGDPAGGSSVALHALDWKGALLAPLVVVVFPDAESLAEATGLEADPVTLTYGVPPQPSFLDEDPTPIEASDWLVELSGASIAFACSAERWQERFVEAVAEWMLDAAMKISEICECEPLRVGPVVRAGFAGYTASRLLEGEEWEATARDRAANEIATSVDTGVLEFDVDPDTLRVLGTSLISYLIGEHGTNGMVAEICDWWGHDTSRYSERCKESIIRTQRYRDGWKEYLGVEEE